LSKHTRRSVCSLGDSDGEKRRDVGGRIGVNVTELH
jgi:hypothetical protein